LRKLTIEIPDPIVAVRVPGEPQSWERAGRSGARSFNTPANIAARKNLQWIIKTQYPHFPGRMDCVNRMGVAAIVETALWTTDADNYTKQLLDSLQGFVFKNDRQVDEIYVTVIRGAAKPNLQLLVYPVVNSLGGKTV
jgi:Holliday junction resolvase RusA-like endonuclease